MEILADETCKPEMGTVRVFRNSNRIEPEKRTFKISSELLNDLVFMSIFSYSFKRLSFNLASIIKHSVSECSFIIKGLTKE
jgi:hypothetical protein